MPVLNARFVDDWQSLVAALDSAPVAVVISDRRRRVMFANQAFERLFDWKCHEIVGRPFPLIAPGREREYEDLSRRVRAGEIIQALETYRLHRDGVLIPVRLSISPFQILSKGRSEFGTIAVLADMSAEKRLEHELREKNRRLEALLLERETLVSMLVHDLKSPLGAIKSNLGFLAQANLANEEEEALLDATSLVDVMGRRVLDLLDISRSEHGALPLRRTSVSIEQLMARVEATLQRRIVERGRTLVLGKMPSGEMHVDSDVLRRIVENLIENASKYGGKRIDVHAEIVGSRLVVRVEDDGPGVPAAVRGRIFDRYGRADPLHAGSRGSHGLGLAFCRIACEAHGGSIRLEPARQGACFVAELESDGIHSHDSSEICN